MSDDGHEISRVANKQRVEIENILKKPFVSSNTLVNKENLNIVITKKTHRRIFLMILIELNSLLFETHKPIEHVQLFIFILSNLQNVSLSFFLVDLLW